MEMIGARVPASVAEATREEAARYGMSVSEYIRFQLRKLTQAEPRSLDELDEPAASDEARAAA